MQRRLHAKKFIKILYRQNKEMSRRSCGEIFKFKKKNIRDKACLINLPTGAGKTGVISLISHLSKERNILIICHRRAVKEQLYREVSSRFLE